ncbi:uncharacterized protein LOC118505812 isoform X2 [Anopheles stephensi]|uniref:uncharacterized protein LOC118505812 isoform X2 n=1 Tax=Anopheles stephensi TaxID=30069 RepID=UPI0016589AEE|nr:uncharacterized protein LOC118505812 isoform X2 [Anopheles stephensi]
MCAAVPYPSRRGATAVSNGKVNAMVSDSQQHKVIKEFLIPDTLKDDIAYCQRSLRDCVKVHQYFVQRCNSLPASQRAQVKRYLLELEVEMRAIGQEQRELVDDLAKRLKHFQRKTATEKHIVLRDDLANGYVAWVLSNHSEVNYTAAHIPHTVSERLNETQLYQKYRLEPLLACAAVPSLPDVTQVKEKRLRKRPVLQTSLLKPREERDLASTALKEESSPHTPPSTPPITATRTTGNRRKTPPETQQPLILKKMLRTRSMAATPSVVATVKEEPTVKQEPIEPENAVEAEDHLLTAIACQESAAVKRGRSNLLQALNKAKTTQKTSSKQSPTANPPVPGSAKSTRNNRAGSVTAGDTQRSSSVSSDSSNSRASTPGTTANGTRRQQPTNLENSTSDDSSIERLPMPPEEPTNALPTSIDEWEQYSFLKLFGLYTIEDSNLLKGRKNERKRRSCCSTERKDFHYGRFDYYEQQFYIAHKRRYNVNKRLLYTATSVEKSIKKRKPWSAASASGGTITMAPPPSCLPVQDDTAIQKDTGGSCLRGLEPVVEEVQLCCVCKKEGMTGETLNACRECSNLYHLSCHVDDDASIGLAGDDENGNHSTGESLPPRPKELCPECWAVGKAK